MIAMPSIRKRPLCGILFALALSSMTAVADECGGLQSQLVAAQQQQREAEAEMERYGETMREHFSEKSSQIMSKKRDIFSVDEEIQTIERYFSSRRGLEQKQLEKQLLTRELQEMQARLAEGQTLLEALIAGHAEKLQRAAQRNGSIRTEMDRERCGTKRGPTTAAPRVPSTTTPASVPAEEEITPAEALEDLLSDQLGPRTRVGPRGLPPWTVRQPPHVHPENVRQPPRVVHAARQSAMARQSPRTVTHAARQSAMARHTPRTAPRIVRSPAIARPVPRTVMRQPAIVRQPPPRIQANCRMSSANCRRR